MKSAGIAIVAAFSRQAIINRFSQANTPFRLLYAHWSQSEHFLLNVLYQTTEAVIAAILFCKGEAREHDYRDQRRGTDSQDKFKKQFPAVFTQEPSYISCGRWIAILEQLQLRYSGEKTNDAWDVLFPRLHWADSFSAFRETEATF